VTYNDINILIGARDAASGVLTRVGQRIRGFASSIFSLKGMLLAGLGGYGMTQILRNSLAAYGEEEQAVAKLSGVLRATGNAAGFTAEQLQEHASALQKMTTFGDEAILGAQSLLATFKEVKGETFTQATQAILDLSAVMEQDLKSSALMVGKALQDPVRGITALRRAGVSFNEEQQKTIKNLAETGRLAEAQEMILAELKSEVGGVANAMSKTATGAMQQFKNAAGDVFEKLGQALAPAIVMLANLVSQAMPAISSAFESVGNNIALACAYIETALDGWALHMDLVKAATRIFVDTVTREFQRLYKQSIQDTSNFLAKFGVAAKGLISGQTVEETIEAFKIIDQSYRDYFSEEEMGRLTEAELTHLKAFEEALAKVKNHYELNLPKAFEQFKFDLSLPVLKMDPTSEDVLREHTKALKNEPLVSRFLTRQPGSTVNVSNAWSKNERKLGELKVESRKHNVLLERLIQVVRDQNGTTLVYGG